MFFSRWSAEGQTYLFLSCLQLCYSVHCVGSGNKLIRETRSQSTFILAIKLTHREVGNDMIKGSNTTCEGRRVICTIEESANPALGRCNPYISV